MLLLKNKINLRIMNELLTCIKLVKMYAWEKSFAKAIAGKLKWVHSGDIVRTKILRV